MITMDEKVKRGIVCQDCGELIDGDDPGHPRSCDGCRDITHWCFSIKKLEKEIDRNGE